jgi:hypothetical protein
MLATDYKRIDEPVSVAADPNLSTLISTARDVL